MSNHWPEAQLNQLLNGLGEHAVSEGSYLYGQSSEKVPGTLGQDFGSSSSKLALCCKKRKDLSRYRVSKEDPGWLTHLVRVAHPANEEDPSRHSPINAKHYEVNSFAAIDTQRDIKTGELALTMDTQIPLKTMFVWRAGIHRQEVLERLPGGELLLAGNLDSCKMDNAVKAHFRVLRNMAEEQAKRSNILIHKIVMSFPNYLCDLFKETDPELKYYDIDKYRKHYLKLMREVWADYPVTDLKMDFISEGQAVALYICQSNIGDDLLDSHMIWERLKGVITKTKGSRWLPLAIVDSGSSSMNIQVQTVYFDDNAVVKSSQSWSDDDWVPGTTGGSHLTNERVRKIFKSKMEGKPCKSGHLAELLAQYEARKPDLDYLHIEESLPFQTSDETIKVTLHPKVIQGLYQDVFKHGFALFEQEMRRLVEIGDNFAIIFCGGSSANNGIRQAIKEKMAELKETGAETGVKIEHLFLAEDFDCLPTTAVACGAALSQMYIPSLAENMRGSAFGIQALNRTHHTTSGPSTEPHDIAQTSVVQWDKGTYADFLFSKGCRELPYIDYTIPQQLKESLRFQLVCDPNHYAAARQGPERPRAGKRDEDGLNNGIEYLDPATGTTNRFRRLAITDRPKIRNGPLYTYDLDFEVAAADLPSGMIRFRMDGDVATRLALNEIMQSAKDKTELKIQLRCTKIDDCRKEVYDPQNRRWRLTVKTDTASKLLLIDGQEELPSNCHEYECKAQLDNEIVVCRDCGHAYCGKCYEVFWSDMEGVLHPPGHKFEEVSLGE